MKTIYINFTQVRKSINRMEIFCNISDIEIECRFCGRKFSLRIANFSAY
jgi:hypothetical protein